MRAARGAFPKWAGMTAYNRGQVLYRVAEMMEGRRAEFAELTGDEAEVDAAIDRWVWYAGWADKLAQVLGSSNPVAGPYFNFTVPEPTGIVGIVAPEEPPLAGLVSRLAPGGRRRERRRRARLRAPPAGRGHAGRGAGDLGRPRRRRQPPHGPQARAGARARRAHGRERARPRRRRGATSPSSSGSRPTTSSESPATATGSRPGTRPPSSS